MMKPRSVYRRCGITHICFKGGLYALSAGETNIPYPSKVHTHRFGEDKPPKWVEVSPVGKPADMANVERWILTEISSRKENKAKGVEEAAEANLKELGEIEVRGADARDRSRAAKRVDRGMNIFDADDDEPSDDDVTEALENLNLSGESTAMLAIQRVAPTHGAAEVLMTAWSNWKNGVTGGKDHPFAGFNYPDLTVTTKVRALGEALVRKGAA